MAKQTKNYEESFLKGALREMILIRRFEERASQMYGLRKIGGFFHPYNGQEAVSAAAVRAIDLKHDYLLTSYRDHGHAISCGMDPKVVMAELFGKITGCSRGKGGSMHMFDLERHMLGGNGIVGAQIPIAAGVAFAGAYRVRVMGESHLPVTLCFFGDGAIHQGAFHETMNLAKIWRVPVVLIVENNQFGMGTSVKRISAVEDFDVKAKAYDVHGAIVDGMNFVDAYEGITDAVDRARKDSAPVLLDIKTYRYKGHSISDPARYRTKEELAKYKELDPIIQLRDMLIDAKLMSEADYKALDDEVKAQVQEAVTFADESPEPPLETMYEDVLIETIVAGSQAGAYRPTGR